MLFVDCGETQGWSVGWRTPHRLLEVLRVLINRFFGCRVTPGSMGTVQEAQKQEGSHKFILVGSLNTHSESPKINRD